MVSIRVETDISNFINTHNDIVITSDVEGLNPAMQIVKIMEYCTGDMKKSMIYNGDVLDYTFFPPSKFLEKPQHEQLCALTLLRALVDGMHAKNVKCLIGNREINKIKLLLLLQSADNDKWWNKHDSILETSKYLVQQFREKQNNFWLLKNLVVINSFWFFATRKADFRKRWCDGDKKKDIFPTTLRERYEYIFGVDPSVGTLGAGNNISCMPIELGIDFGDDLNYELRAAIVFTAYARMLFNNYDPNKKHGSLESKIDGILKEYLLKANCVNYADVDGNLLIFAHGGMTTKFLKSVDTAIDILDELFEGLSSDEDKKKRLNAVFNMSYEEACASANQTGGSLVDLNKLLAKMDKFNKQVHEIMARLFNDQNPQYHETDKSGLIYFSPDLLKLVFLSTPADSHPVVKELVSKYDTLLSPILVGSPVGDKLTIISKEIPGKKVYNIFSHIPKGIGYGFGQVDENVYYINTDFSNSLLKDPAFLGDKEDINNDNYLLLHLIKHRGNPAFFLQGETNVNLSAFAVEDKDGNKTFDLMVKEEDARRETALQSKQNYELKNFIYKDADIKIPEGKYLKINYEYTFDLEKPNLNKSNYVYHGMAKIGDNLVSISSNTMRGPPFKKTIMIEKAAESIPMSKLNKVKMNLSQRGLNMSGGRQRTHKIKLNKKRTHNTNKKYKTNNKTNTKNKKNKSSNLII